MNYTLIKTVIVFTIDEHDTVYADGVIILQDDRTLTVTIGLGTNGNIANNSLDMFE